jgi:hypothetical protein
MALHRTISELALWCQDNNLSLNVSKTNYFRKQKREHALINRTAVERVSSLKFLDVHITEDLTWTNNTTLVKRAQQRLYFLKRLKKFGMPPQVLSKYYCCTIKSILTGCITAWYRNCTVYGCKALQRVVKMFQYIAGTVLPPIQDIYSKKGLQHHQGPHTPQKLFSPFPSGRRYRRMRSNTNRIRDSFHLQAIVLD